MELARDFL